MTLLHIAARADWEHAQQQGSYQLDGPYLHLSERHQVLRPANLLYRGRDDLVLLVIARDALPAGALVYEPGAHGEDERFPHLYAPLPLDAVVGVVEFPCGADGSFALPADVY